MNAITMILMAFALAMDAFAVSVVSGVMISRNRLKKALQFAMMFGGFQMMMPVLGWGVGYTFRSFISHVDHWIVFVLLSLIGLKMIWEGIKTGEVENVSADMTWLALLGLSIATSIDALAVGVSFSFLKVSIVLPVIVIGGVTFAMSFGGVLFGSRLSGFLEKKAEVLGGIILIGMGIKILVTHLLGQG